MYKHFKAHTEKPTTCKFLYIMANFEQRLKMRTLFMAPPFFSGTSMCKITNSFSIVACPDCNETFTRPGNQRRHWDRHHGRASLWYHTWNILTTYFSAEDRPKGEHRYDCAPFSETQKFSVQFHVVIQIVK